MVSLSWCYTERFSPTMFFSSMTRHVTLIYFHRPCVAIKITMFILRAEYSFAACVLSLFILSLLFEQNNKSSLDFIVWQCSSETHETITRLDNMWLLLSITTKVSCCSSMKNDNVWQYNNMKIIAWQKAEYIVGQSYWLIAHVHWHWLATVCLLTVFAARQNSLSPTVLSFGTR